MCGWISGIQDIESALVEIGKIMKDMSQEVQKQGENLGVFLVCPLSRPSTCAVTCYPCCSAAGNTCKQGRVFVSTRKDLKQADTQGCAGSVACFW